MLEIAKKLIKRYDDFIPRIMVSRHVEKDVAGLGHISRWEIPPENLRLRDKLETRKKELEELIKQIKENQKRKNERRVGKIRGV